MATFDQLKSNSEKQMIIFLEPNGTSCWPESFNVAGIHAKSQLMSNSVYDLTGLVFSVLS